MTPRLPSIREISPFHTSQRARIEWVKFASVFGKTNQQMINQLLGLHVILFGQQRNIDGQ